MLSCHGIVRLPNDPELEKRKWKTGFFVSFRAFTSQQGKQYYYRIHMFVSAEEMEQWDTKLVKGSIFYLKNGEVNSYQKEGWTNPIYNIRVKTHGFKYLQVVPIGE